MNFYFHGNMFFTNFVFIVVLIFIYRIINYFCCLIFYKKTIQFFNINALKLSIFYLKEGVVNQFRGLSRKYRSILFLRFLLVLSPLFFFNILKGKLYFLNPQIFKIFLFIVGLLYISITIYKWKNLGNKFRLLGVWERINTVGLYLFFFFSFFITFIMLKNGQTEISFILESLATLVVLLAFTKIESIFSLFRHDHLNILSNIEKFSYIMVVAIFSFQSSILNLEYGQLIPLIFFFFIPIFGINSFWRKNYSVVSILIFLNFNFIKFGLVN